MSVIHTNEGMLVIWIAL